MTVNFIDSQMRFPFIWKNIFICSLAWRRQHFSHSVNRNQVEPRTNRGRFLLLGLQYLSNTELGKHTTFQRLIPTGERSGLLTPIAAMEHAVKALMYGLTRRKLWSGMVKVKGL
jgi:hypothetical protein